MTDTPTTRRDILRRAGTTALILGAPTLLAACLAAPNDTRTSPDGQTLIVLKRGLNCHNGACIGIDARRGRVSASGREEVAVPEGIDLSTGTLSEDDFARLVQLARRAPQMSSGGNGGGAGGGAGGGCGGGGNCGGFSGGLF